MSNALQGTLQNGYVCQDLPDTVIRVQHSRENPNYIRTFGVDLDKTGYLPRKDRLPVAGMVTD
ncbi:MAG TPA: hypothetical protein VEH06_02630 [Candidatus Bathyarchaeia archaeon]|nr:hypothetical protein [Candidatus Bathyarchaeia archaeon]